VPWKDVLLIDDNLELVPAEVLDSVERTISCKLPTDYRAVMTTFGVGTYCGVISFFHPNEIPVQTKRSREIWAEYSHFFWPQSDFRLPLDQALLSFVLAVSIDGDEIIFFPPVQSNLFVLPRHDDLIYRMPSGLRDPLDWQARAGLETIPFRYFEPSKGRGVVELHTGRTDLSMDSIYRLMLPRLSPDAVSVPKIERDGFMVAFFKSERSAVQLTTGSPDDRRIRVRIEYNPAHASAVDALIHELIYIGFSEIGRFPSMAR
jgi:hypothetical protein